MIKKDREVCELQDQLVEELAKRQQMQYTMIQKDQTILDLQQQLRHMRLRTRTLTSLAMSQTLVQGDVDADMAGSSCIQAALRSQQNAAQCNDSGFSCPVPLGLTPPMASGPQSPEMQPGDVYGILSPRTVPKLRKAPGALRKRNYSHAQQRQLQQQQQQQQGSSIMDGCSMSIRAATFCCSPGVSSPEDVRTFGPAPAFIGSYAGGGGAAGNHWSDRQSGSNNLQQFYGSRPPGEVDRNITCRTAHTFA
mmetsp:Transcript_108631/g.215705  ORF Transcript_108631/g.215705 Transcript_108631/m.215705 type:complete len:250 (+) Transcript_108631:1067-1816(+)